MDNEGGVSSGKIWDAEIGDLSELSTDLDPAEFAETDSAWTDRESGDLSEFSAESETHGESESVAPQSSYDGDEVPIEACQSAHDHCSLMPEFEWEDSLIIFDWDDTLFPTTWLQELGFGAGSELHPTKEQWTQLCRLAEQAARTLDAAKRFGTVVIITNAETGWIEMSCQMFMPWLLPFLQNIKTLSARSTYEPLGVQCPTEWKCRAFETEIAAFCNLAEAPGQRLLNFISIGDSLHEREALIQATAASHMPRCCTKSVKFIERPGIEQLAGEHQILNGCFQQIYHNHGNLDLCIGGEQL